MAVVLEVVQPAYRRSCVAALPTDACVSREVQLTDQRGGAATRTKDAWLHGSVQPVFSCGGVADEPGVHLVVRRLQSIYCWGHMAAFPPAAFSLGQL